VYYSCLFIFYKTIFKFDTKRSAFIHKSKIEKKKLMLGGGEIFNRPRTVSNIPYLVNHCHIHNSTRKLLPTSDEHLLYVRGIALQFILLLPFCHFLYSLTFILSLLGFPYSHRHWRSVYINLFLLKNFQTVFCLKYRLCFFFLPYKQCLFIYASIFVFLIPT